MTNFYNGLLDDIWIYNRTLTVSEIKQLYSWDSPTSQPTSVPSSQPSVQPAARPSSQPSSLPSRQPSSQPTNQPSVNIKSSELSNGLVAYYSFDWTTNDKSGNHNDGVSKGGVSFVSDRFGIQGHAVRFNAAASGYVEVPGNQFNFNMNMSISLWILPDASQNSFAKLIDKSYYDVAQISSVAGWAITSSGSPNNFFLAYVDAVGAVQITDTLSCSSVNWNHLVYTKTGSQVKAYVNGVPFTRINTSPSILPNGDLPLIIGGLNGGQTNPAFGVTQFYNGLMDDLFIYNRTLTAEEVRLLGNYHVPTSQPSSQPSRQPSVQPSCQPYSKPSSQPSSQPTFQPAIGFRGDASTLADGLVAYYPFEGNANDKSGNGNHCRITIANPTTDRFGRANKAYNFNGGGGFMECPGDAFNMNINMSISLWMNPVSSQGTNIRILDKGFASNTGGWCLKHPNVNGVSNYIFQYITSPGKAKTGSTEIIAGGQWNHYVLVKSFTSITTYVNGVRLGVTSVAANESNFVSNGNTLLTIGALNGGNTIPATNVNYYYNGKLDDIFIFNRVISFEEVEQLYDYHTPTSQPSKQPTSQPTRQPSAQPSSQPSTQPAGKPSSQPSSYPSTRPSSQPTSQPTRQSSTQPSSQPSTAPTGKPFSQPSSHPSERPSSQPSKQPTDQPSTQPSCQPSTQPAGKPFSQPSSHPSERPSSQPSKQPTSQPTCRPSAQPSSQPSSPPTGKPSSQPSSHPSERPSSQPSKQPTSQPTCRPSAQPSSQPSSAPTGKPSSQPSSAPTGKPSSQPSSHPSERPSSQPTGQPTSQPTRRPSAQPSSQPSFPPTGKPSSQPSSHPSERPSSQPTGQPTQPSSEPVSRPDNCPASQPSSRPTLLPFAVPSSRPTSTPPRQPILFASVQPSCSSTSYPSNQPSSKATLRLSKTPSSFPSSQPTSLPLVSPTFCPTAFPLSSSSAIPFPSSRPTLIKPSSFPRVSPSCDPLAVVASVAPVYPSSCPTCWPSISSKGLVTIFPFSSSTQPKLSPTSFPSKLSTLLQFPTVIPTRYPSISPVDTPSSSPSFIPTRLPQSQMSTFVSPSSHPSSFRNDSSPVSSSSSSLFPSPAPLTSPANAVSHTFLPSIIPSVKPQTSSPTVSPLMIFPKRVSFQIILHSFGAIPISSSSSTLNINLFDSPVRNSNSYLVFGQKGKRTSDIILSDTGPSSSADSFFTKSQRSLYHDIGSRSVAIIGDLNKDNSQDIVVGYPFASSCVVYLGSSDENGFSLGFAITGKSFSDGFGWSVAKAGDMNHDHYDDIAISAKNTGIVYVIYGKPTELLKSFSVSSLSSSDGFQVTVGSTSVFNLGVSLSSAGDFNNDGYPDLLMSGLTSSSGFVTYVVFGNSTLKDIKLDSTSKRSFYRITSTMTDFAGVSVSGVGDINNDGCDDIVIGSIPFQRGYGIQRSYVIYGKLSGFDLDLVLPELSFTDGFKIIGGGFLVTGTGDMNNDGFADMMISSYYEWSGKSNSYIVMFPSNITSFPTFLPTSSPSLLPPTSSFPSSTPSSVPSSTFPTSVPTVFFNSSPTATMKPSLPLTRRPTVTPSSRVPTICPSLIPSRYPTVKPSFSLVPTLKSEIPTVQPSFKKTRIPTVLPTIDIRPSSFPSFHPTIEAMIKEEYIMIYQNDTICRGSYEIPDGKQQVIISCEGDLLLSKGSSIKENSKIIYSIVPVTFHQHLIIENFHLANDQIDLSLFSQYVALSSLPYSLPPLTVFLSENQSITLTNLQSFALSSSNVILSQESTVDSTSSAAAGGFVFDLAVIASLSLFGSCFLWFMVLAYIDRKRRKDKAKKEEEKQAQKVMNSHVKLEDRRGGDDVYSHFSSATPDVAEPRSLSASTLKPGSAPTLLSRHSDKERSPGIDGSSVYSSSLHDTSLNESLSGFSDFSEEESAARPVESRSGSVHFTPTLVVRSFFDDIGKTTAAVQDVDSEENSEKSDDSSDEDEEDEEGDEEENDNETSDYSLLDV
jgi:hypothetical protein